MNLLICLLIGIKTVFAYGKLLPNLVLLVNIVQIPLVCLLLHVFMLIHKREIIILLYNLK